MTTCSPVNFTDVAEDIPCPSWLNSKQNKHQAELLFHTEEGGSELFGNVREVVVLYKSASFQLPLALSLCMFPYGKAIISIFYLRNRNYNPLFCTYRPIQGF